MKTVQGKSPKLIYLGKPKKKNSGDNFHQGFFRGPVENQQEFTSNGNYILETSRQLCRL